MALILNIDTSGSRGSVSLANDGQVLQERANENMVDHASWLHTAIGDMTARAGADARLRDLHAVAVVSGPGSYTGLRVGMSAAKGFCYALNIPLIGLSSLKLLAHATYTENISSLWLCPMIDARRMEVFVALYNNRLEEEIAPAPMIVDKDSFAGWLNNHEIAFFGNGSPKFRTVCSHPNARFISSEYTAADIARMSWEKWNNNEFEDLAYAEPGYLKAFYTPTR
jgi:tRNA threonylcarbamoyladenosine biosynthesis protein TsaB